MYMYVCTHMCIWWCVSVQWRVYRGQRIMFWVGPILPLHLWKFILHTLGWLSWELLWIPLSWPSISPSGMHYNYKNYCLWLWVASGDSNSGCQAFVASALSVEPASQSQLINVDWMSIGINLVRINRLITKEAGKNFWSAGSIIQFDCYKHKYLSNLSNYYFKAIFLGTDIRLIKL